MNEEKEQTTELITDYGGTCVTWAHCKNCGQAVSYPTENRYNACPYCKLRILWHDAE
jgi:hypothetical protein